MTIEEIGALSQVSAMVKKYMDYWGCTEQEASDRLQQRVSQFNQTVKGFDEWTWKEQMEYLEKELLAVGDQM